MAGVCVIDDALISDGEVVWARCPDADIKVAMVLRITRRTETTKPGLRGEHEENRKTIAQGMPDRLADLW